MGIDESDFIFNRTCQGGLLLQVSVRGKQASVHTLNFSDTDITWRHQMEVRHPAESSKSLSLHDAHSSLVPRRKNIPSLPGHTKLNVAKQQSY